MADGIILRLRHTGTVATSLLIDDVDQGTDGSAGYSKDGPVYIPYSGTPNVVGNAVDLVLTERVVRSYEHGSIRGHLVPGNVTDRTTGLDALDINGNVTPIAARITAQVIPGDAFGDSIPNFLRLQYALAAGGTLNERFFAPAPLRVLQVQVFCTGAPVTAGTYTLAVTGGGNNLLGAATFDLTTLPPNVLTNVPLTATLADLLLAKDALLLAAVASNNGDLAGVTGLMVQIRYGMR